MIVLSNNDLKVEIHEKGAELQSICATKTGIEYLWQGDDRFWAKRSPLLFPIVGQLQDNTYEYHNKSYTLPRHGFARERVFEVEHLNEKEATFLLLSDATSRAVYPFEFELRLHYQLDGNSLRVIYHVKNKGIGTMYFSIGGHPAFKVPITKGLAYDDYYLEFGHIENANRYSLQNGLIDKPIPFLNYAKHVQLKHELFYGDALVFKHLQSEQVTLKCDKNTASIHFNFQEFPYLGIWAAKDADFVCIEPWHGIADSTIHNKNLIEKEGIISLEADHRWQAAWQVVIN